MEYFYLTGRLKARRRNVHDEDLHCLHASLNIFHSVHICVADTDVMNWKDECTVYRISIGNSGECK
jgi:hypothetical protein